MSELSKLDFLLGRWKGISVDQFGEKGTLETTLECTHYPSEKFIQLSGESRKDGKILNRGVEFIGYDQKLQKYIYKRIWSYGFIENGVGDWEDQDTLMFDIRFDNEPQYFEGTRWRAFIRRYGRDRIGTGLYTAKSGEEYRLYGESKIDRISEASQT